jgi:hypothetical protein
MNLATEHSIKATAAHSDGQGQGHGFEHNDISPHVQGPAENPAHPSGDVPTTGDPEDSQYIAIAAIGVPNGCTSFGEIVLRGALQSLLRRAEVSWSSWSGSCQPLFILELITVSDRAPVLRAVQAALKELGILEICQVAYLDWDELYWRTVYPSGAGSFDQFIRPEDAARAAAQSKALLSAWQELLGLKQHGPPGTGDASSSV